MNCFGSCVNVPFSQGSFFLQEDNTQGWGGRHRKFTRSRGRVCVRVPGPVCAYTLIGFTPVHPWEFRFSNWSRNIKNRFRSGPIEFLFWAPWSFCSGHMEFLFRLSECPMGHSSVPESRNKNSMGPEQKRNWVQNKNSFRVSLSFCSDPFL